MNIFTSVVDYKDYFSHKQINFIKSMIKSLMLSNSENDIDLYLICDIKSKETIRSFLKNDCNLKAKIHIKYVDNSVFEKYGSQINSNSYRPAIYYKLFISNLFPNIDKYLWLDYDTLVTVDLNDLYNINMSGIDIYGFCDTELPLDRIPFINTGVVLTNAKAFREKFTIEQIIKIFKEKCYNSEIPFIFFNCQLKLENNIFYNYPGTFIRNMHVLPPCEDYKIVLKYAAQFSKIIHFYIKDTIVKQDILEFLFEGNPFLKKNKDKLFDSLSKVFC